MTRKQKAEQPEEPAEDVAEAETEKRKANAPEAQDAAEALTQEQWLAQGDPGSKAARLAALAERASLCVACDLARTRTNVVFGEGNPEAPLVLIGEGPGQHEDATGRPFVGRSGMLLDACLRENGMTRKHIYICNVVRCRACVLEAGRLKNRPPTPDEAAACSPWLEQTLGTIQPLVILCLGAPSANAIIHKGFKIMSERGQWFESKYCRYAMASLHPAYILRQQGEAYDAARRALVADIAAARQKVIEAKREPKLTLF
ncbi:MAG TPA: uracil-DNA glycosylase [Chthonomonadaceae bacterium]|nr:uracil-DNA glycosylase [Chthonomonadaceae bacterium]